MIGIDRATLNHRLRALSSFTQQYDIAIAVNLFIFGLSLIFFSRMQPLLSVVPPPEALYGLNFATSLGCLFVAAAPVFYLSLFLRRKEVDWFSIALFILAAIVSLHYIHISNNGAYTNDWNGHWDRTLFITSNWLDPYGYNGWQRHHPPLYYYCSAIVVWAVNHLSNIHPLTAARFLSWFFYLIFNVYALLTLRTVGFSGLTYYMCAALLLLWPMGLHAASQISNEPLYYAVYATSFYYAIRWYKGDELSALRNAIIIAFVAFIVRTGAAVLLVIITAMILMRVYQRRFKIGKALLRPVFYLSVFALCCVIINSGKLIFKHDMPNSWYIGVPAIEYKTPIDQFITFRYDGLFNEPDAFRTSRQVSYWSLLLRTFIFNEYQWSSPQLMALLNFFLVLIFLYMLPVWATSGRETLLAAFPYVAAVCISIAIHIAYVATANNLYSINARYVYPNILCFCVMYGMSHNTYRRNDNWLMVRLGPALIVIFTLLSIYFFWTVAR